MDKNVRPLSLCFAATLFAVYAHQPLQAQGPVAWERAAPTGGVHASGAAGGVPSVVLNASQFDIPFTVDRSGAAPSEVHLYVSRDAGQQWTISARQRPDGGQFRFQASDDGEYWFATRTIDVAGNAHPRGPSIAPQLRVRVDTSGPQVDLTADADAAGQVKLEMRIQDSAASEDAIQIYYMTDDDRSQWVPVDNHAGRTRRETADTLGGQWSFQPPGQWRYVHLRIVVADQAGNQTILNRQIERPRIAGTPARLAAMTVPTTPPAPPTPAPIAGDSGYAMRLPSPQDVESPRTPATQVPATQVPATQVPTTQISPTPLPAKQPPAPPSGGSGSAGAAIESAPPATLSHREPSRGGYATAAPTMLPLRGLDTARSSARSPGSGDAVAAARANESSVEGPTVFANPHYPSDTPRFPQGVAALPASQPQPHLREPMPPSSAMRPIEIEALPTPRGEPAMEHPASTLHTPGDTAPRPGINGYTGAPPTTGDRAAGDTAPGETAPGETAAPRGWAPGFSPIDPRPGGNADGGRPSASGGASPGLPPRTMYMPGNVAVDVPPVQIPESEILTTRYRQFSLDYEVDGVGSRGVGSVELWGTKDGGRTWTNWGSDPDNQSPFDIQTESSGLYGFRIVVVGGNGLTSPTPRAGDPADIFVRVDTEAPRVRLTAARYGEGDEAGSLVIEYLCEDENLAPQPITLLFSETPEGPWTTIATGLEAVGRYAWPADPRLPRQIYLRIEAEDIAGNVGTETKDTPVSVQGLAPRGRIRSFQAIPPN